MLNTNNIYTYKRIPSCDPWQVCCTLNNYAGEYEVISLQLCSEGKEYIVFLKRLV